MTTAVPAPPRFGILLAAVLGLVLLAPQAPLSAQAPYGPDGETSSLVESEAAESISRDEAPRVYLDCRRCDDSHIRREINFVNHVRSPDVADVHVLVTEESTGAGGRRFTLAFMGRGAFAGVENTLSYVSPQTSTDAEQRDGLTGILKLGLVPYVAQTPLATGIQLTFRAPDVAEAAPAVDPWQNWTFEVYGGGNFQNESTQGAWNARYGFYANRVTEDWKIRLRPYFNHNHRTVSVDEGDDINVRQRRHGFESFVIRSLGPHFGAGIFGSYATTTIDNLDHGLTLTPAIEYSLYPYDEASRRQVTLTYRIGYELNDYIEETIYEKTEEALLSNSLSASVQMRQPWGSVSSRLTGSRYLHDASNHRVTLDGNVSYRLGGGISLNVGGSYQRINDQLSLPRGEASLEDVLLQRRRLATSYRGTGHVGLSYTFGSIFTNVVNPRL